MNKIIENELIEKLARQSHFHVDDIWTHQDRLQKFAELIVKECAGLLEEEAESGHDEGTPSYDVLIFMSKWMKRYFGVEE